MWACKKCGTLWLSLLLMAQLLYKLDRTVWIITLLVVQTWLLCYLLGSVAVNITQASYTRPRKAIRWSNVHCTGMESRLSQCSHYTHYQLSDGVELMDKLEVAGVVCQREISTNMRILQSGISTAVFTGLIFALFLTAMLVTCMHGISCAYTCVYISCVCFTYWKIVLLLLLLLLFSHSSLVAVGVLCYCLCKPKPKTQPQHPQSKRAPEHKYEGHPNEVYKGYEDEETYDVPEIIWYKLQKKKKTAAFPTYSALFRLAIKLTSR